MSVWNLAFGFQQAVAKVPLRVYAETERHALMVYKYVRGLSIVAVTAL